MSTYRKNLANNQFMQELLEKNIPEEMKELPNWVAFRSQPSKTKPGKYDKVLLNPNVATGTWAKSNDSSTWTSYEKAIAFAKRAGCQGVGFVLKKDLDICCIDLDGCIIDGKINDVAKGILKKFGNTYCEKSISGKGLHIFCKGKLPDEFNQRNEVIEMYNDKRIISMTGTMLKYSKPELKQMANLEKINKELLGERPKPIVRANICKTVDRSESFIIRSLREHRKYGALFAGDMSAHGGDQSRADLALCMGIAFYTKDETEVDEIFRRSGLYRPKWDMGAYGKITIQKAIQFQTRSYNPGEFFGNKPKRNKRSEQLHFDIDK